MTKAAFYSAQDADSLNSGGEEGEGNFYIWTPQQISDVLGDDANFLMNALDVTPEGNFEGANVFHMLKLPSKLADEAGIGEEEFLARLDQTYLKLHKARNLRSAPHKDRKIVVSWNAMMIETLAEASSVFSRPDYYDAAADAAHYIVEEMMGEGELKRVSYEGSVGVDAQLPDHAGLGMALIALYDYSPPDKDGGTYLEIAAKLAAQIERRYSNESDEASKAYRMSAVSEGLGDFIPYEDTEIPSGNGLTLSLFDALAKRGRIQEFSRRATLLAAALSGQILDSPVMGGYSLLSVQALSQGENGYMRYLADGAVKVTNRIDRVGNKVQFLISVKEGWHINANVPLEDYFIPTELIVDGKEIAKNSYPQPLVKSLKFNDKPMALYEGNITLDSKLPKTTPASAQKAGKGAKVVLTLQACSDQICLLPEEVIVQIW